jgi:biopolymer transport protein ExbB
MAIMIDRRRRYRREASGANIEGLKTALMRRDLSLVKEWIQSHPGLHAGMLTTAADYADRVGGAAVEQVDRAVRSYLVGERLKLEKGLPVLATLGANTPFIGLFGTVLGIIRAFAALGETSGGASSVMSGISQALVATAAGLFVAIPAVVAFNTFSNRLKALMAECESLRDLYVARVIVERAQGQGQDQDQGQDQGATCGSK